jgi:hypothetical protein
LRAAINAVRVFHLSLPDRSRKLISGDSDNKQKGEAGKNDAKNHSLPSLPLCHTSDDSDSSMPELLSPSSSDTDDFEDEASVESCTRLIITQAPGQANSASLSTEPAHVNAESKAAVAHGKRLTQAPGKANSASTEPAHVNAESEAAVAYGKELTQAPSQANSASAELAHANAESKAAVAHGKGLAQAPGQYSIASTEPAHVNAESKAAVAHGKELLAWLEDQANSASTGLAHVNAESN